MDKRTEIMAVSLSVLVAAAIVLFIVYYLYRYSRRLPGRAGVVRVS